MSGRFWIVLRCVQVLSDLVLRAVLILQVSVRCAGVSLMPWGFVASGVSESSMTADKKLSWALLILAVEKSVMNLMFGLILPDACGIQVYQHVPSMMQSRWCVIKDWPKCRFSCWSIGDPFCNRLVPISSIRLQISESLKLGLLL